MNIQFNDRVDKLQNVSVNNLHYFDITSYKGDECH